MAVMYRQKQNDTTLSERRVLATLQGHVQLHLQLRQVKPRACLSLGRKFYRYFNVPITMRAFLPDVTSESDISLPKRNGHVRLYCTYNEPDQASSSFVNFGVNLNWKC